MNAEPVGIFYSWWRGDDMPVLPRSPSLEIARSTSTATAGDVPLSGADDAARLLERGHELYVARRDGAVVAWGWCATETADISELGVEMRLPRGNRYLWGFVTLPEWRGQGIYPRILLHILQHGAEAPRFWIGHDYGNIASAHGIRRAGFSEVGRVYPRAGGELVYVAGGRVERAPAAAELLGMRLAPAQR